MVPFSSGCVRCARYVHCLRSSWTRERTLAVSSQSLLYGQKRLICGRPSCSYCDVCVRGVE